MFPHFPAALRQMLRGKLHRLTFQFGGHRVVPPIESPEERNHSSHLDGFIFTERLLVRNSLAKRVRLRAGWWQLSS
jgi:hypothetical protein